VSLGQSTTNILSNYTAVYGQDFILGDGWVELTARLGFDNLKKTYLLWLWLDTAV